jgi:hypothetical protein
LDELVGAATTSNSCDFHAIFMRPNLPADVVLRLEKRKPNGFAGEHSSRLCCAPGNRRGVDRFENKRIGNDFLALARTGSDVTRQSQPT